MRPLAPDGCNDLATQEETTLLDEDVEVSDVRPPGPGQLVRVPLCAHHRQVYQSASAKRKCGVLTCHKASKGARHGVPLCYDHLCEQGGTGARKDSPHPNGMLQGFRRRFTRRAQSRSRSPAFECQQASVPPAAAEEGPSQHAKKESGMAPARSSSVDLGKVMIPSPPRGGLEQEDVMGKPVWLKLKLNYVNDQSDWIMCMGELCGYTPGGVRGDRKLEVFVKYLDNTLVIDPKYLEDMMDAKGIEDLDATRAQLLVKEVPPDAECLGLDIKGYLIPEILMQRLAAWEGRTVAGGRRLNDSQLKEVKKNLASLVRKHSAGYVKGELWPSWPAEAELGIDKQVRGRDDDHQRENLAPRTRSRSRSHSLARAMKEEDDLRSKLDRDTALDGDTEEMTGEGIVEAYLTAVNSGQTQKEAIDAIQMIFEVDMQTIGSTMRTYIRKNCGKQNEQVEVAIKILKGMSEQQSARSAREDGAYHEARAEQPKPQEKRNPSTPDKLFPAHYGEKKEEGSLIRPAEETGKYNPLTANDSIVGQLFGMGGRVEEVSTRAGAGGDEEETHMSARVVHALEGIRKATEGDKKGNPGTRSAIGSEESLDVYLARGCNTLTVEVCPDVTGKELFDALKRARNEIKMIGSVIGLEHKKERIKALEQIEKAHEQDSDVWPESYCYSLWEELKAAWVEELRESRRQLCRILNTDNPRKEDLKFVALAPDSGFHFPRTFDLAHPEGYYQQVCVPRQEIMPRVKENLMAEKLAERKIALVEAKAEQDEKVKDGAGQKQGWLPPEEYEDIQYTQLEDELRELTRGRMLNAIIEKQEMTIDEVLLEATEKGCPELAQEAEKVLGEERSVGWVDEERQAWVSPTVWHKEKGYGEGKFEFQCGPERRCWRYLDYKDRLPVPDELASALGLQPGDEEERQCLVLHPAAGILLWGGDWDPERVPSLEEVRLKAQSFRAGLWDEAAKAIGELGDPAPWIGAREAEVRGSENNIIPFLIHGGHIRLLVPIEKEEPVKVAAELTLSGQSDREWPCEGWREFLANEDPAAPLVPGKRPKCPRCQDNNPKQGKAAPQVPWSFNEHPVDTQELILMGAHSPLKHRPAFAYGIRVQEVFAGSGSWTKAMKEAGLAANEPIELFSDPLQKKGRREQFDLKDEKVANFYLQATMELPGPSAANVWEFGTPCTSYCDFNILNGGTRSFSSPEGGPHPTASEQEGNYFCDLTCRMRESLYHHDKEFILESSMPSGRYPKIWDQPAIQRLQQSTGALIVPTHLCEWGSAPTDRPEMRYKKGQWNLVSPGLYLHALLLSRRCQGQHRHMDVKGESDLPGVPRTRRAQVYPARLCKGWALVVQAAYAGWDTIQVAQALEVIQESDGREGEIPHKAAGANRHQHAGQSDPSHQAAPSHSTAAFSFSERCGSAEIDEFQEGFGLLRGHHCGSIGEGEFSHGIPIPEDPLEPEGEEEEEEGATSDEDRRMNPRDEARVMARLVPREVSPGDVAEPVRPYEGNINIFGPPRPLEGLDGRSEDWWDLQEDNLFLVRHHVMPRTHLFGSHYGDWTDCPVSDHLIRSDRRTWMYPQRRELSEIAPHERVFLDNWRVDLARLRDIPDSIDAEYADWTGATTFYLYDPLIRPELGPHFERGQEERGETDSPAPEPESELRPTYPEGRDYQPVFHPPREFPVPTREQVADARRYYPGGGVWDPWNGGRIEGDDAEQAEEQPGSSSDRRRRSRSRSRGRGPDADDGAEERRAGYLSASCILEAEETEGNRWMMRETIEDEYHVGAPVYSEKDQSVKEEVLDKALCYVHHCREHPKYEPNVIKQAVELGDDLLRTAGTLEEAMRGLRAARRQVIGVPTIGATSEEVLRCLESDHAQYLKAANRDGDTADFGSALPGELVGVEGRVKLVYGGLPFGWCGAPGEYMAFALAGRAYHESFKPEMEGVNGPTPFSSEWLMDDSVIVEPLMGVRPWQAVDALGHSIEKIWGKAALNLDKQIEEGTLPEPKALKMRYLLALPELQYGVRQVRLKVAQELRGLSQYAAITIPPLRTELGTLDLFLCPSKCVGGYIQPNVKDENASESAWRCWDETLALLRLWFETPYEGSFESSMESMLSTRELLALPGMSSRLRWVGGDATPDVAGALDWKGKRYMREDAKVMLHALGRVPELEEEPSMKIALAELLCFVGLAAAESSSWHGEIIAYATDNQNVRSWLTKRQSRCTVARHILRVLGMLEAQEKWESYIEESVNGNRDQCEAAIEGSSLKGTECLQSEEDLTWVFASIAEDSWGGTRSYVRQFVKEHRPSNALIDLAREGPVREMQADFKKLGYVVNVNEYLTTHFGDPVAKRKFVLVAHRGSLANDATFPDEAPRSAAEPASIKRALDSAAGAVRQEWLASDVEVTLNNKISTSGDRTLPWPAGHYKEGDKKELPYDIRGPALTCRKGRSMVVLDHRGEAVQARAISAEEEWLLNGGRLEELHLLREAGAKVNFFKKDAAMKFPQQSAHHLLSWYERWRQGISEGPEAGGRVGVCRDPDRVHADEQVRAWMRAWQGDNHNPRANYERWLAAKKADLEGDQKVGGRRQTTKRAKSGPPDRLVLPSAIGRGRERLQLDANRELRRDQAWLDALAAEAVMSKLSEGTRAGYEVGWKQWCLWRRMGRKDVYLTGESKEDRKIDEDELLRFMTYLAHVMGRTEGTIKQRLFAIKMGHLVAGHEDPTLHKVRIWAALNGYKRWQPETKRKYPVLPAMLLWIKKHLSTSETLSRVDQAILWAAIMVGFFFLLRASEFLVTMGRSCGTSRTLKGNDIEARRDNLQVMNFHQAEEIVIYLKGSQTDQYNQGTVRNQFRSGDELCVVTALANYQAMKPERFAGAEADQPLFRLENGKPLQRTDIQGLIQLAAVADGQSTTRYGSHSLRIGGATAMYQTTKDLDIVKRFGRWNSDAFHGYLWESH
ncbi:unnamed protein product, partial [Durusdinium trenchii]